VVVFAVLLSELSAVTAGVAAAASMWKPGLAAASRGEAHAQAAPSAPTGETATCISPDIDVTWTAVTKATTYTVYESTDSDTSGFSAVATGVAGTSWTSVSPADGDYWFKVTAYVGTNWVSVQSAATAQMTVISSAC
jgi:hypothetical protein